MSTRMLQRRGSSAEWAAADPILGDGEIGFERDTGELKIGNGVKRWSQLSYPYPASAMIDAKGDLIVGSADNTPARLPAGTNGQHLAVNADGSLGWQTPYAATDKVSKAGDTMTGLLTLSVGATLPNTQSLSFGMPSGNAGYIRGSLGSQLKILGGPSGLVVQNNADTNWLFSVNNTGQIEANGSTAGLVLHDQLDTNKSFTEYVYSNTWGLWSNIGGARVLTVDSAGNLAAAGATLSGYLNLTSSADGLVHYNGGVSGPTTWIYADIAGVQKFRLERSGNVRATSLNVYGGGDVLGQVTTVIDNNGMLIQINGDTTQRVRFTSDSSRTYLQTDKPLTLSTPFSGTARQIFDILGDISSHGQYAGFSMYERTTDTNFFTWYTSGATLRLYSSTTGFNKFSIDSNGNILGDAANAIAIGWLNDPVLTGTALQTNPSTANNGALVAVGRSSSNKVFVVRGATGQVSDLEQWQKNDGTSLAEIDSGGGAHFPAAFIGARVSYGTLTVTPTATNMIGQVIRGVASQTAALQQWQDVTGLVLGEFKNNGVLALHGPGNGLTLYGRDNDTQDYVWYVNANIARLFSNTAAADRLSIDGNGSLVSAYTVNVYDTFSGLIGGAGTRMQLYAYHGIEVRGGRIAATIPAQVSGGGSSDASMYIYPATATQAGLVIRGVVSQSANMQEWQDNGGGLRAKLDNGGGLYAQAGIFAATNPPVYLGARLSAIASGPGEMALVLNAAASQTADIQQWRTSTGTVLAQVFAGGGLAAQSLTLLGATVTTATPSSGAAGSLPSFPAGYLSMTINGVVRKIPFYA